MKRLIYDASTGKLSLSNTPEEPKLVYKECNSGISLELVFEERYLEDVMEAIKGSLPDDVLAALGIPASGEDLSEVCDELKSQGYECRVTVEETS
jgi:hypothetical protein